MLVGVCRVFEDDVVVVVVVVSRWCDGCRRVVGDVVADSEVTAGVIDSCRRGG